MQRCNCAEVHLQIRIGFDDISGVSPDATCSYQQPVPADAVSDNQTLAAAVRNFANDLSIFKERARPFRYRRFRALFQNDD